MLVVGLVLTFGCASALEGVAAAQEKDVPRDRFEVTGFATPPAQPAGSKAQVTSLFDGRSG